jgi:hypothetical protein
VTDIDARLSFYSGFVKRSLHQIFDHSYIKRNVFFTFDSTCAVSHGQSNSLTLAPKLILVFVQFTILIIKKFFTLYRSMVPGAYIITLFMFDMTLFQLMIDLNIQASREFAMCFTTANLAVMLE